jgi:hypothetical protein
LHVPPEHVPLPLQSELDEQWPHVPLEHVPNPAQSELELQYGSACCVKIAAGESAVIDAARRVLSASNDGTGTGETADL